MSVVAFIVTEIASVSKVMAIRISKGWDGGPLRLTTYYDALLYAADLAREGIEGYVDEVDTPDWMYTYHYTNGVFIRHE